METLRRRLTKNDEGFTLIELMVVVLIIAILIAIAIPTFLGAQNRARDRGTQSDLRNAVTAAKTLATDSAGLFQVAGVNITAANMTSAEPSLTFGAAGTASTAIIAVNVEGTGASITLVKASATGEFFCISATDEGVVTYDRGANEGVIDTNAECNGAPW